MNAIKMVQVGQNTEEPECMHFCEHTEQGGVFLDLIQHMYLTKQHSNSYYTGDILKMNEN